MPSDEAPAAPARPTGVRGDRHPAPLPGAAVAGVAAAVVALLVAVGGRYGFHRDELYFVEGGRHPAWGYPDQPPLVPLLARGWYDAVGGSLGAFRIVPALLAAALVVLAALTARELGQPRPAQLLAAVAAGTSSTVLGVGHLFSTTTFDAALTATAVLLLLRAVATGSPRAWLAAGAVAGLALQVKLLGLLVAASVLIAVLLVGPRGSLRTRWPFLGAGLALAVAAPYLLWQQAHGWPQLAVARSIAAGGSGSSTERALVVPLQFTLTGPLLAPLAVAGLVALLRRPDLRPYRWVGVAFVVLLGLVVVTGGKPYYTLGLLLPLLGAGAGAVVRWVGRSRARVAAVAAAGTVNLVTGALLVLPIVPADRLAATPIVDIFYDAGEQVGWPALVEEVAAAYAALPPGERERAVVLTGNYGEAGSARPRPPVRCRPAAGVQRAHGVRGVGPSAGRRRRGGRRVLDGLGAAGGAVRAVHDRRRVDNGVGLDNEEQGVPVRVCRGLREPWPALWDRLAGPP